MELNNVLTTLALLHWLYNVVRRRIRKEDFAVDPVILWKNQGRPDMEVSTYSQFKAGVPPA
jgi:hypothetical protein